MLFCDGHVQWLAQVDLMVPGNNDPSDPTYLPLGGGATHPGSSESGVAAPHRTIRPGREAHPKSSLMPDPTLLTARLAMLLYAASLFARLIAPRAVGSVRRLYTAGCAVLLIHVAVAFHVHHHWSHAAARAHVEETTARYTGVASDVGLWLNYLAAGLWTIDVVFWWAWGDDRHASRQRWVSVALQAFLLFMAFNAAVVFAHASSKAVGAAVALLLAGVGVWRFFTQRAGRNPSSRYVPGA